MKKFLCVVPVFFLLSACMGVPTPAKPTKVSEQDKASISGTINYSLKDPTSAMYRNWQAFTLAQGDRVVCVEVNAKNSFGGYAGFEQFYFRVTGSQVKNQQIGAAAEMACNQARNGMISVARG